MIATRAEGGEGLFLAYYLCFYNPSVSLARPTSPYTGNIIKLRKWQKEDTHNKAEKSRVMCIFLTKKHGEKTGKKSVKKVLKKERIYGILYRKLAAE